MKKLWSVVYLILILACQFSYGQIGIMTNDPDASAELDITANNKGLLIPRITLTADLSNPSPVNAPVEGLMIYNTGLNQTAGLYYWTGSQWILLQTPTDDTLAGPGSSTDMAIVRFDGNSGKLVQNSVVTISDNSKIANINNLKTNGFTLTTNPADNTVLTSDKSGNASWETPKSVAVKKNDTLVVANASVLNFAGGNTVQDEGNNEASISYYNNAVTRDLIQLSSGDSLNLNTFISPVAIPWDIEIRKNNATFLHSNTTNPSRIYTRIAGIYEVNYIVNTISQTIQRKTLRIRARKNGNEIIPYSTCYSFSYNMSDFESAHNSSSFLIEMGAYDYFELIANGQTHEGPLVLKPVENVIFMRLLHENTQRN